MILPHICCASLNSVGDCMKCRKGQALALQLGKLLPEMIDEEPQQPLIAGSVSKQNGLGLPICFKEPIAE